MVDRSITVALVGAGRAGKTTYLRRLTGSYVEGGQYEPTSSPTTTTISHRSTDTEKHDDCLPSTVTLTITDYPADVTPTAHYDAYIVFRSISSPHTLVYPVGTYVVNMVFLYNSDPCYSYGEIVGQRIYMLGWSTGQGLWTPLLDIARAVRPVVEQRVIVYCQRHLAAYKIQRWFRNWYYTPNRLGFSPFLNSTYDALMR